MHDGADRLNVSGAKRVEYGRAMSHRGKHFEGVDAQSIEGVDVGLVIAK